MGIFPSFCHAISCFRTEGSAAARKSVNQALHLDVNPHLRRAAHSGWAVPTTQCESRKHERTKRRISPQHELQMYKEGRNTGKRTNHFLLLRAFLASL